MPAIAVFNQRGGVGKTTTTLNVAAALAARNRSPLLIDVDPQAHLSLSLRVRNVDATASLYAFFADRRPLLDLIRPLAAGLRLVPASFDLSKVESLHAGDLAISQRLKAGVAAEPAHTNGPVLLDCSPTLGVLSLNALAAADAVLMPVSADFLSVEGAHKLSATLDVLEQRLAKRFVRRIVVTRFDSRRRLSSDVYRLLRERFGETLCKTVITETVALAESPMHGKDIFSYAAHSQGAAGYRALTEELPTGNFFA